MFKRRGGLLDLSGVSGIRQPVGQNPQRCAILARTKAMAARVKHEEGSPDWHDQRYNSKTQAHVMPHSLCPHRTCRNFIQSRLNG